MPLFKSITCLDPGIDQKTPAIWHGAGAYHGVLSQKPRTKNGIIRSTILFLAWVYFSSVPYTAYITTQVRAGEYKLWGVRAALSCDHGPQQPRTSTSALTGGVS